jgi:2-aminoadipate transaminase
VWVCLLRKNGMHYNKKIRIVETLRKISTHNYQGEETMSENTGQAGLEKIFFTRGVPPLEGLPVELIDKCMQAALNGPDGKTILQYGHNGGYAPLRSLISEQYGVSKDQVLVGNGSLHLMDMIAAMLVKPGDIVLVEQPSYDRAIKTFRRRGARVIGIPLEQDGLSIKALEQVISYKIPAMIYVVPDFQNPTGITTSREKREALVQLAEKYDFWIAEDVPYRTLRYSGESEPLMRDISPNRVLTVSSYSKLISPALRVGYLVGPLDLVKKLTLLAEDTILAPVLPSQACVMEFHRQGFFTSNLNYLKDLYAPRLQAMISAIRQYLPNAPFSEPEGGYFVSITLPVEANSENLLERAQQVGLVLTDGASFFADSIDDLENPKASQLGDRFIRLPFCSLTPGQIQEGISRLADVVKV